MLKIYSLCVRVRVRAHVHTYLCDIHTYAHLCEFTHTICVQVLFKAGVCQVP